MSARAEGAVLPVQGVRRLVAALIVAALLIAGLVAGIMAIRGGETDLAPAEQRVAEQEFQPGRIHREGGRQLWGTDAPATVTGLPGGAVEGCHQCQ